MLSHIQQFFSPENTDVFFLYGHSSSFAYMITALIRGAYFTMRRIVSRAVLAVDVFAVK